MEDHLRVLDADKKSVEHQLTQATDDLERVRRSRRLVMVGIAVGVGLSILTISIAGFRAGETLLVATGLLAFVWIIAGTSLQTYLPTNRDSERKHQAEVFRLQRYRDELGTGHDPGQAYSRYTYERYYEELIYVLAQFEKRAKKHRDNFVLVQLVVTIGSATASVAAVLAEHSWGQIIAVIISLSVAVTAGLNLVFRPKEMSDNLQLAIDEIAHELSLYKLRIGPYLKPADQLSRSRILAERVEDLKRRMAKRQRELSQLSGLQQPEPSKQDLPQEDQISSS